MTKPQKKPMTLKRKEKPATRVQIAAALDSEDSIVLFEEPTRIAGDPAAGIEPESDAAFEARKKLREHFAAVTLRYRFGDPDVVEQCQLRWRRARVEENDRVEAERAAFLAAAKPTPLERLHELLEEAKKAGNETRAALCTKAIAGDAGARAEIDKSERRKKFPALFRADYRTEQYASEVRAVMRDMLTEYLLGIDAMDVRTKQGSRPSEELTKAECILLLEQLKWHELAALKLHAEQTPSLVQSQPSGP